MQTIKLGLALVALATLSTGCGTKQEEKTDASSAEAVGEAEEVQGTVKTCHDGDTCNVVLDDGEYLTVRLSGIDAPEVSGGDDGQGQPFGREARDFLRGLVKGKHVTVRKIDKDPYKRTIGEILVNGKLVDIQMVEAGFAEAYKWATGPINKQAYKAAEQSAKAAKKGIWSLEDYESPGDFRARTK